MSEAEVSHAEATPQTARARLDELVRKHRNGANWFYWIAGMSLVNSLIVMFSGDMVFVVGLAVTQMVDAIGMGVVEIIMEGQTSSADAPTGIIWIVRLVAFVISSGVAMVVALFGWLANKRYGWAFILGMSLYLLDGLVLLAFGDLFSAGFHGLALVGLFSGYGALKPLREIEAHLAMRPPAATPPVHPPVVGEPVHDAPEQEPGPLSPEEDDQLCASLLDQPDSREALDWLRGSQSGLTEARHTLGDHDAEDALLLVESLYRAGAVHVHAVEIDEHPEDLHAGKLVIELPADREGRRRVLDAVQAIIEPLGYDAPDDHGQRYVFVMLG